MWNYEKRLQYPVKITQTNPKIAQIILTQFGGPDGELGAAMRYLAQRYTMPYKEVTGILTDIGTEELAQKWYQLFLYYYIVDTHFFNRASMVVSSTAASLISISASGTLSLVSHPATVLLSTCTISASSFWVIPFSLLNFFSFSENSFTSITSLI